MANREKGESTVEIGGRSYTLVVGLEELCALEEIVSRNGREYTIKEIIDLVQRGSLRFAKAILWAALIRHQPKTQMADVLKMVDQMGGLEQAMVVLGKVFESMNPDAEDVQKAEKGARPRKARIDGTGAASTSRPAASA